MRYQTQSPACSLTNAAELQPAYSLPRPDSCRFRVRPSATAYRHDTFIPTLLVLLWFALAPLSAPVHAQTSQPVVIDSSAPARPFPHFWEHMFGSERAVVTLRDSYRRDLREVKQVTAMEYIRFHAIFHDEMGVYDEDAQGQPIYNFSYVDQIYDGLLENGVRPFVELSFMPKKLAASPVLHPFWYKPNGGPAQRLWQVGRPDHAPSRNIWSNATASTKSPSGISRSGTSPTSTSGLAIPSRPPTSSSTTTPPVPSRQSTRACA